MTAFTPGPWAIRKLGDGWLIVVPEADAHKDNWAQIVGPSWDYSGGDDGGIADKADAVLIASAPDLYEALVVLTREAKEMNATLVAGPERRDDAIAQAIAAIAKAEGTEL